MNAVEVKPRELIDWSVSSRSLAGEPVSGDVHLVQNFAGGVLLVGIDGAGHGNAARAAAGTAAEILQMHAAEPIVSLVRLCHTALASSRGAAMTLVRIDESEKTMEWLGVGNVMGCLRRANQGVAHTREWLSLHAGLVGYRLPPLQPRRKKIAAGDLLVLATDGIDASFCDRLRFAGSIEQITADIMNQYAKGNDDALVLAARYLGCDHE